VNTRCPACDDLLSDRTLAGRDARIGPVLAVVDARAITDCPSCSSRRSKAALQRAVDSALERGILFAGRRGGQQCCAACASVLDLPMRASKRSVTVEPPDGPPFTLTFSLPFVRCGTCAADNVPAELEGGVRRTARIVTTDARDERTRRNGPLSRLRGRVGRGSHGPP